MSCEICAGGNFHRLWCPALRRKLVGGWIGVAIVAFVAAVTGGGQISPIYYLSAGFMALVGFPVWLLLAIRAGRDQAVLDVWRKNRDEPGAGDLDAAGRGAPIKHDHWANLSHTDRALPEVKARDPHDV